MALKTTLFDPADYLTTAEACAVFRNPLRHPRNPLWSRLPPVRATLCPFARGVAPRDRRQFDSGPVSAYMYRLHVLRQRADSRPNQARK